MKKTVFLIVVFCGLSSVFSYGQVTIGSTTDPHPAAILDLQSTGKGLLLPRVSLTDADAFLQAMSESDKEAAAGLLVFNDGKAAPNSLDAGIYIWTGNKWKAILITANLGAEPDDNPNDVSAPDVLGTE